MLNKEELCNKCVYDYLIRKGKKVIKNTVRKRSVPSEEFSWRGVKSKMMSFEYVNDKGILCTIGVTPNNYCTRCPYALEHAVLEQENESSKSM